MANFTHEQAILVESTNIGFFTLTNQISMPKQINLTNSILLIKKKVWVRRDLTVLKLAIVNRDSISLNLLSLFQKQKLCISIANQTESFLEHRFTAKGNRYRLILIQKFYSFVWRSIKKKFWRRMELFCCSRCVFLAVKYASKKSMG